MDCRPGCSACCIAPSITSAIPGMPHGKPAGVPCVQLDEAGRCKLFGKPERPAFCGSLQPSADMCGTSREQALRLIGAMELSTKPEFFYSLPWQGGGRGWGMARVGDSTEPDS